MYPPRLKACGTGSLGYKVKAACWLAREENASQIRSEKACVPGSCLGVRESRGCSVAGCCPAFRSGAASCSPPAARTCGGAGGDVASSGEVFETLSTLLRSPEFAVMNCVLDCPSWMILNLLHLLIKAISFGLLEMPFSCRLIESKT